MITEGYVVMRYFAITMFKEEAMNEFVELTRLLRQHFPFNLARIKIIAQIVPAIIKVTTVCQTKLADAFVTKADPASSQKRIYR